MSNFLIKKETYESLLKKTKDSLVVDDKENGISYLKRAIEINEELISCCSILEIKERYKKEHSQLIQLRDSLIKNGTNPFLKTESKPAPTSTLKNPEQKNEETHIFSKEYPSVTLKDVAGLDEVKEQIQLNILLPLKDPDLYYQYCDKLGSGILMYGPPGCGKSFIAEAIAGELKCAYAVVNTYDILSKYVGEAPKKIKDIFDEANKYDKCLIFFDELDAIFASRDSDESNHSKDILTSILTCMSGFNTNNKNSLKVVIGATNRPWILDPALLRGGRFDTHIYVGLPDFKARKFIIERSLKNHDALLNNSDITIDGIAELTDSYSGADIKSIMEKVKQRALLRAINNKQHGIIKNEIITKNDIVEVMNKYRNSINKEYLDAYEAFRNGA